MNKRSERIRAIFTQPVAEELSADNQPAEAKRVPAGAVRAIKNTFSEIETENDALRARLLAGENTSEISAELIDPSPFADRFEQTDYPAFETLKQSIAERGQQIPVLLRLHPASPGRYQTAYGHRRIHAALALGRTVKAVVRDLSDDDLIVAQGVENSAREDLSFIERAVFALRLEEAGRSRLVIQQALAIDKAEASKLINVAKGVPQEFVRAIGKAPKVGRPRWLEFVEVVKDDSARMRTVSAIASDGFSKLESDERFARALAAAMRKTTQKPVSARGLKLTDSSGHAIGEMSASDRNIKLILAQPTGPAFAEFLSVRLPRLYEEFRAFDAESGASKRS